MLRWFLLVLLTGLAWAAPEWASYCNARFGFCVQRPAFMAPQPPPQNGDGQEFRFGAARLIAFGSTQALSLPETYRLAQKDLQVTYRVLKSELFVVSGYKKGSIVVYHYTRATQDAYISVYLEYPASQKKTYDPLIKPIVDSLKLRR